jgi:hypothetical protein
MYKKIDAPMVACHNILDSSTQGIEKCKIQSQHRRAY